MKNMHFSNSILRYAVLLICFLPMALYAHGAQGKRIILKGQSITCLLYTSDAADE